jgi:hypothetical protein
MKTFESFVKSLREFPAQGLNLGRSDGNKYKSNSGNSRLVAFIQPFKCGESAMPINNTREGFSFIIFFDLLDKTFPELISF